jgi:DNA-binding transcriptional regulator GbsR (MarR family)
VLGEGKDAIRQNTGAKILAALPTSEGEAMTIGKICKCTGISRASVQRILAELAEKVGQAGKGTRRDPFRYYSKTNVLPAQTEAGG